MPSIAGTRPASGGANGERINCECGYVITGDTDSLLINDARKHIAEFHPEVVGKVSNEDLLAMAEVVA